MSVAISLLSYLSYVSWWISIRHNNIYCYHHSLLNLLNSLSTFKYRRMGINVPSNQIGLRIQILNNNDDGSSNLNRFFTGTVTLINSIETTVSNNISISK